MGKKNTTQDLQSDDSKQKEKEQMMLDLIPKTAIIEYLDIVRKEYEIERQKKQSFENRAGLIMALLGAICIFLFEKVKLGDIINLTIAPLTFFKLIIIISGLSVYIFFFITIIMILKTIVVKNHSNFEVKSIDEDLIIENKLLAISRIIFTYRDIIIQHRLLNEGRAKDFRMSIYGISATLVFVIIYISFT